MFILGIVVGWFLGLGTMIWYINNTLEKHDHVEINNKKLFIIKE